MKNLIYLLCVLLMACSGQTNEETFTSSENSTTDLFEKIAKPAQQFVISNDNDTVIEGLEGTIISLPKNCFVFTDGTPVDGAVTIELKEFFTISDMILNNLTTTSNNKLLETGGMIHIGATSNNEEVRLNQKIDIKIPNKLETEDVELFIGSVNDGFINWNSDSSSTISSLKMIAIDAGESDTTYIYDDGSASNRMRGSYYLINTFNLKWLNVDKFLSYDPKEDCMLIDANKNVAYFLLFDEYKSISSAYHNKKQELIFPNSPIGKKAKLIGFKYIDEVAYIGIKEITISQSIDAKLDYEEKSILELKTKPII